MLQEGARSRHGEPGADRRRHRARHGLAAAVGDRWVPVPSEGGHADYPPRTEDEIDLLRYLREHFGRVSGERVASGPGLFNIYNFLRDVRKVPETPGCARRSAAGRIRRRSSARRPWPPRRTGASLCSGARHARRRLRRPGGEPGAAGHGDRRRLPGGRHRAQDPAAAHGGPSCRRSSPRGASSPISRRVPVRVILNQRAAMLGAARRAAGLL